MKTTFIVTLMVLISLHASAQISRTILGMTLGVTTKAQCVKIMNEKGFELVDSSNELGYGSIRKSITFAGTEWNFFQFKFHKGRLCEIVFQLIDIYNTDDRMSVGNALISNSLYRKYSKYKINIDKRNLITCDVYTDGRTQVSLFYQERSDYQTPFLGLGYEDIKLSEARRRDELKYIEKDL